MDETRAARRWKKRFKLIYFPNNLINTLLPSRTSEVHRDCRMFGEHNLSLELRLSLIAGRHNFLEVSSLRYWWPIAIVWLIENPQFRMIDIFPLLSVGLKYSEHIWNCSWTVKPWWRLSCITSMFYRRYYFRDIQMNRYRRITLPCRELNSRPPDYRPSA